jgi:hypothetical protein
LTTRSPTEWVFGAEAEHDTGQQSPEAAAEAPNLEGADDAQRFESGLAFGLPAFEVGAGVRVPAALDDGQFAQRCVARPVSVRLSAPRRR